MSHKCLLLCVLRQILPEKDGPFGDLLGGLDEDTDRVGGDDFDSASFAVGVSSRLRPFLD